MSRILRGRGVVRACVFTLFSVLPSVAMAHGSGGGTEAILLPKGQAALDITSSFVKSKGFSDQELIDRAAHHIHAHDTDYVLNTSFRFGYGVTDDISFAVRIPYVYRSDIRSGHHSHSGGVTSNTVDELGDSSGLGDVTVMGLWRFLNDEDTGIQAAGQLGLKMPTGKTDVSHDGEKLEAEHQPGSGSFDPMAGLTVAKSFGLISLNTGFLYTLATEGSQDTDLGDRADYSVGVSYRLSGEAEHHHDTKEKSHSDGPTFDISLSLNGEWQDKESEDGEDDDNTGGNELFLTPGVRYSTGEGWAAALSFGVPVASNLEKAHAGTDYKIMAGISRSF